MSPHPPQARPDLPAQVTGRLRLDISRWRHPEEQQHDERPRCGSARQPRTARTGRPRTGTRPPRCPTAVPRTPRAAFSATAVDSCSAGTTCGRHASSAGPNRAAHTPITAATTTMCGTRHVPPQRGDEARGGDRLRRLATQHDLLTIPAVHQSSRREPGESEAAAAVPSTRPDATGDPVSASTSSGKAIIEARQAELRQRLADPQQRVVAVAGKRGRHRATSARSAGRQSRAMPRRASTKSPATDSTVD